jgi:hypothetical protein
MGQPGGKAGQGGGTSCDMNACMQCVVGGGGASCAQACGGCDDGSGASGSGAAGGGDAGNGGSGSNVPKPECIMDDECGISFECLACNLNDAQGWCFQTKECNSDSDCGIDGKCGYNVASSAWRCLPADHCK